MCVSSPICSSITPVSCVRAGEQQHADSQTARVLCRLQVLWGNGLCRLRLDLRGGNRTEGGTGCVFQVSWVKSGVSDSTKRNPLAHSLPARERERVFGRKAWIGRPWSGRGTTG